MDVSSMLSNGAHEANGTSDTRRQNHQYPTRHGANTQDQESVVKSYSPSVQRSLRGNGIPADGSGYARASPIKKGQKHVVFQLIDPEDPRIQARLPMRVLISTNDTTDSIITTVKNFYGLYDYGVSFENKDGFSIIAAYDNFENDMIVYVRTVLQPAGTAGANVRDSVSPKKPSLGPPFEMRPTHIQQAHSPSRTAARSVGVRSLSPQPEIGRRSASVAPGGKPRPQRTKSKDNSVYGDGEGYSSGDNGGGSVTSSRRSKTELVNAEISVDNIVEGGRRKGGFESSQLPLFVPPQVPISNSISSISPQRRANPLNVTSPYAYANQQTFSYTQPLPSPQSYSSGGHFFQNGVASNGRNPTYAQPSRPLRNRASAVSHTPRQSAGGIMPTPDPTVGSAISDEDVALQLMRLGDPMAFSHGRTSTSTVDDALSGKADAASSDEEDDEEDNESEQSRVPAVPRFPNDETEPQRKKPRLMNDLPSDGTSGDEYEDRRDGTFSESDNITGYRKGHKSKGGRPRHGLNGISATGKITKPRANSMAKPKAKNMAFMKTPMSPSSMPAPSSRKNSIASINFQHQLGTDEEDLSSKPRCQRCRKSKKGCDRQRPCGRCKDAGIGIEGCISEDEGNGRKGRYGRHMGVTIKKADETLGEDDGVPHASVPANGYFLAPALPDKSKKRKR